MGVDTAGLEAALGLVKHAMTAVEPRHYAQATAWIERDPQAFRELVDASFASSSMIRWAATHAPNGTADVLGGAMKIANSNALTRFGMRRFAGTLDTVSGTRLLPIPRQLRDVMGVTAATVRASQEQPELASAVLDQYRQHAGSTRDAAVAFEQLAPDLRGLVQTGRELPAASRFAVAALKAVLGVE
jgi:hypothetical protein